MFYEAPRRKKTTHEEAGPPPVGKDKADKGVKTEWTMYEYESLASEEEFVATCADGNAKVSSLFYPLLIWIPSFVSLFVSLCLRSALRPWLIILLRFVLVDGCDCAVHDPEEEAEDQAWRGEQGEDNKNEEEDEREKSGCRAGQLCRR